ncbi:MAG: outer membrane beta-barrel protein [Pseudomonadota bacterium]
MLRQIQAAIAALFITAAPAAAELELSFYLGWQETNDSTVSGTLPGGVPVNRSVNWSGDSFDAPYYYGGRVIWWTQTDWGFGVEGTHTKAYASVADLAALGLGRFELSDGHNIFTVNAMKRWPGAFATVGLTPYVGGGVGIAVPHVDVQLLGSPFRTYGLEQTGFALRGLAGLKYDLTEDWAIFGEYQFTWSDNDLTVDPTAIGQIPGELSTEIVTHAINFGVSYSF